MRTSLLIALPLALLLAAAAAVPAVGGEVQPPHPARPSDPSGSRRTCPPPTTASQIELPDGSRVGMVTMDCVERPATKQ